jgi:hypothetical protein
MTLSVLTIAAANVAFSGLGSGPQMIAADLYQCQR